jgi:hypothetical protein
LIPPDASSASARSTISKKSEWTDIIRAGEPLSPEIFIPERFGDFLNAGMGEILRVEAEIPGWGAKVEDAAGFKETEALIYQRRMIPFNIQRCAHLF